MADVSKIQLPSGSTVNIKDDRLYIIQTDTESGIITDAPNNIFAAVQDGKAMAINYGAGGLISANINYTYTNGTGLTALSVEAGYILDGSEYYDLYEYDFTGEEWVWSGHSGTLITSSSTPATGNTLIYNGSAWVAMAPGVNVYIGTTAPSGATTGTLWLDTSDDESLSTSVSSVETLAGGE